MLPQVTLPIHAANFVTPKIRAGFTMPVVKLTQTEPPALKPENTRMGLVGNAVADRLETKIHESTGLKSQYNSTTGKFEGYTIDPDHPNFKDKNSEQIKEYIANKHGIEKSTIKPLPSSN